MLHRLSYMPQTRLALNQLLVSVHLASFGHVTSGRQSSRSGMQGLDHTLRYLSLHDNRYLRYFKGHTQQVTTLCLSPKNDLFMSAAQVCIPHPQSSEDDMTMCNMLHTSTGHRLNSSLLFCYTAARLQHMVLHSYAAVQCPTHAYKQNA